MYADLTFYTDVFMGVLFTQDGYTEADYNRNATHASDYIDYITMGKAKKHADLDAVKKCCCALAEQYVTIQNIQTRAAKADGEIQSESVGSHSRSYRSGADMLRDAQAELANIARRYLLPTGLLYRGVSNCVHATHCHGL